MISADRGAFRRWLIRIAPVIMVAGAVAIALFMVKHGKAPRKLPERSVAVPVAVTSVQKGGDLMPVHATGSVHPKYQVKLVPQVSGVVTWIDPDFVRGNFFKKGDLLFKIDDTDYKSSLEEARAKLTKALLDLEKVKAQAEIARREWKLMKHPPGEKPLPLVFYEPQQENARQLVASARAQVERARVNLSRTRITAPFNCYVKSESVEPGQYVKSGSQVAELVFSDQVEIVLPVQEQEILWLGAIKEKQDDGNPLVKIHVPGLGMNLQARIDRIAPYVDSKTRLVDLFVLLDDPFCLNSSPPCQKLPVGTFVDATIEVATPPGACRVSESAIRKGDKVYLVRELREQDGKQIGHLEIVDVQVLHHYGRMVWIKGMVEPGDLVVISPVSGAADGMAVLVAELAGTEFRGRSFPGQRAR